MQAIFIGSGPPLTAPTKYGQRYIDTLNKIKYTSVGFSTSADWVVDANDAGAVAIISVSTVTNIGSQDTVVLNPSTTGTANLPTAVGRTRPLKLMNASAYGISIVPFGSETINGDPTNSFSAGYPYSALELVPIGGNWYVF